MAKAVGQRVSGQLLEEAGGNGRLALLLRNPKPEPDVADLLILRFALVLMGTEAHLFPSFLIDDWGGEVRGLSLYDWVREKGNQFPRAEIFGFNRHGASAQYFLRELELYAKLPAYVYPDQETALAEGWLLSAVLLPDAAVGEPTKIKRPSQLKRPLASARVSWWQVPPNITQFDFSLLDQIESADSFL